MFESQTNGQTAALMVDLRKDSRRLNNIAKATRSPHDWDVYKAELKKYKAVKCNDDPHVLKTLAKLGTNFDCASKKEISKVLNLGIKADRIIFAHPCKMISHVEYAKSKGVTTSTVDSECEIFKLHRFYPQSNLVIRIRCDGSDVVLSFGEKYGCDSEKLAYNLMTLARILKMNVIGISFHVGTGCNDLQAYKRAIAKAQRLFDVGFKLGFNMKMLDIGGGFPGNDDKKFKNICEIINTSLKRYFPQNNVNIIAEPGRYFVTSAYTLLCKIHSKKEARLPNGKLLLKQYYLNDGVYGSFNNVLTEHFKPVVQHFVNERHAEVPKFNSLLWGPTCDALDKIAENVHLPDLKCGEFLAFPNMGAYSLPLGCRFNGFNLPKTIYYDKATQ
uniref:Orn/DAP/Arg decarboxylase 2 N-terminal domain-containing protein n=1 Tax=Stomoxys calcitrans TaxID=35570 RepID=A0A1I8P420_STOCA